MDRISKYRGWLRERGFAWTALYAIRTAGSKFVELVDRGIVPIERRKFLTGEDTVSARYNSLAEELLKGDGKGVVGTLAPSSLSVHWAADVYLEALTAELVSGRHQRLGDALLAAQAAYIEAGARPELLRTYQLLADPALPIAYASGGTR